MASASASVVARGFSTNTAAPAPTALMVWAPWDEGGVATTTASAPAGSWSYVQALAPTWPARSAARSGDREATATTGRPAASAARACTTEMVPAPAKARRVGPSVGELARVGSGAGAAPSDGTDDRRRSTGRT